MLQGNASIGIEGEDMKGGRGWGRGGGGRGIADEGCDDCEDGCVELRA